MFDRALGRSLRAQRRRQRIGHAVFPHAVETSAQIAHAVRNRRQAFDAGVERFVVRGGFIGGRWGGRFRRHVRVGALPRGRRRRDRGFDPGVGNRDLDLRART